MTPNFIRKSALLLGLLALVQTSTAAKRPNIILIVADDQGYADFGFRGLRNDIETHVLDRIASEGTTLTQAYATSAICSPSRMGLTSGLHQARFGAFHYGGGRGMNEVEVTKTLPARLQRAGYRTAHIGKHHFVGNRGSQPDQHAFPLGLGYDRFFGSVGGRIHYLYHSEAKREEYSPRMSMETMWDNDQALENWEGFTTDDWTDQAIDFIAEPSEKPFFVQMAYNAVHNFAWQLPPEELEKRGLPTLEDLKLPKGLSKAEAAEAEAYNEWYDGVHRHTMPEGRGWYIAQLDALNGKKTKPNSDRILHWDLGFQWSLRSGKWKILVTEDNEKAANLEKKEALYVAKGVHLYNLVEDPSETQNVAAQYPEIVQQLQRQHDEWRTEVDAVANR